MGLPVSRGCHPSQLHRFQNRAKLRRQPFKSGANTSADTAGRLGVGLRRRIDLPPFQSSHLGSPPPVAIDDGVPQDPVEPTNQILPRKVARLCEDLRQGRLHDVLGRVAITHL